MRQPFRIRKKRSTEKKVECFTLKLNRLLFFKEQKKNNIIQNDIA